MLFMGSMPHVLVGLSSKRGLVMWGGPYPCAECLVFRAGFQSCEKWLFGKQKPPLSGTEGLKNRLRICREEPCPGVMGL